MSFGMPNYNNQWVNPTNAMNPQNQPMMTPPAPSMSFDVVALVNGPEAADRFLVAAGHTAALIDFPNNKMWIKSTDLRGIPMDMEQYSIKKDDLSATNNKDDALRNEVNVLNQDMQDIKHIVIGLAGQVNELIAQTKPVVNESTETQSSFNQNGNKNNNNKKG